MSRAAPKQPNGRLGIVLPAEPTLPPIRTPQPAIRHHPHLQQQREELAQLQRQFVQRLRVHKELHGFEGLARHFENADGSSGDEGDSESDNGEDEEDDCFVGLKRVIRHGQTNAPMASQFLRHLVGKVETLVQQKLREELGMGRPEPSCMRSAVYAPEDPSLSALGRETASITDVTGADAAESTEADKQELSRVPYRGKATTNGAVVPGDGIPKRNTFRTTLRSRAFPPTRVASSERIAAVASSPLDFTRQGVAAYVAELNEEQSSRRRNSASNASDNQWVEVIFPRSKPSLSRPEIDAFTQWAQQKLTATTEDGAETTTFADAKARFADQLQLRELVCYELARLVFDKCPTTARFLHGLFVELTDIAGLTVANAERDAEVVQQRQKNVQLELRRLTSRRVGVERSLAALQETLRRRQRHLLNERERIIHKRKKLNLLLGADQSLIRAVIGVLQHGLGIANEALHSSHRAEGSTGIQSKKFTVMDELVQLVSTKYAELTPVVRVSAQWRDAARGGGAQDEDTPERESVVVMEKNEMVIAVEEFKCTLGRLSRLLASKSPDSNVGWNAQELWDMALFIPTPEDVQDLEHHVQRLCLHVEASILARRDFLIQPDAHASVAVQTDISACVPVFRPGIRLRATQAQRDGFEAGTKALSTPESGTEIMVSINYTRSQIRANGKHVSAGEQPTPRLNLLAETHQELLAKFLPPGLRPFIHSIPIDYQPHQLSLSVVHGVISFVLNEMWLLVQAEHERAARPFAATTTARLQVRVVSAHEYLYRIFLLHFRVPSFVVCRLLDFLISVSRLDTQSCKVRMFCRLLDLPGVDALPAGAFWFLLKATNTLQRACGGSGNYFLLDASGENEFVPQTSAWEAISQLFQGVSAEVTKRLRLRLSNLVTVYGTIWLPLYKILEMILEEWKVEQAALRLEVEDKVRSSCLQSGSNSGTSEAVEGEPTRLPNLAKFMSVFGNLNLRVHRLEAAHAYRQLVLECKSDQLKERDSFTRREFDPEIFLQRWVQVVLNAVNQARYQQFQPLAPSHTQQQTGNNSSNGQNVVMGNGGMHLGPPSEALLLANQQLSFRFLKATWEQTKADIIRWLDAEFHDMGLQVRLVEQMDQILDTGESSDFQEGWSRFQQLIQIVSIGKI